MVTLQVVISGDTGVIWCIIEVVLGPSTDHLHRQSEGTHLHSTESIE